MYPSVQHYRYILSIFRLIYYGIHYTARDIGDMQAIEIKGFIGGLYGWM